MRHEISKSKECLDDPWANLENALNTRASEGDRLSLGIKNICDELAERLKAIRETINKKESYSDTMKVEEWRFSGSTTIGSSEFKFEYGRFSDNDVGGSGPIRPSYSITAGARSIEISFEDGSGGYLPLSLHIAGEDVFKLCHKIDPEAPIHRLRFVNQTLSELSKLVDDLLAHRLRDLGSPTESKT